MSVWTLKLLLFSFLFMSFSHLGMTQSKDVSTSSDIASLQNTLSGSSLNVMDSNQKEKISENEDLAKIQNQLNNVLLANQRLQEDYLRRMQKIRAISTQAKIHQQILDQIRSQDTPETSAIEDVIRQEKVKLIADQARRNQEILQSLRTSRQNIKK